MTPRWLNFSTWIPGSLSFSSLVVDEREAKAREREREPGIDVFLI